MIVLFSLYVLVKPLLFQLHGLQRSCFVLQLAPLTRRRPHDFWLKRGERPACSGRERSRNACRERKPKGKKKQKQKKLNY